MSDVLHGVSYRELATLISRVSKVGLLTGRVASHEVNGITLRVFAKARAIMLMGDGWAVRFNSVSNRPRGKMAASLMRGERGFIDAVKVWDGQSRAERWLLSPCDLMGEGAFVHEMTLVRLFGSEWGL